MKKRNIIIIIIIVFILLILMLKIIPFESKIYHNKKNNIKINVPTLSITIENKTNKLKLISLNSKKNIKNIYDSLDDRLCHSTIYKYDKKNNIIIKNIKINSMLFVNVVEINYYTGKYTNDECNKIIDYKKIKYKYYTPKSEEKEPMQRRFKYLNKDGKKYDVYSECLRCLEIKRGMGYYATFKDMLSYGYMSMYDLINFMDYQSVKKTATKETYKDGTILYKNDDFALLICNTREGNKDIYINDKSLVYEKNYCK